jgi:1-acyl-sn-glycerol-3-phosphate acyltransferase
MRRLRQRAVGLARDVRFGARAAACAGLTAASLARLDFEARGLEGAEGDAAVTRAMRRYGEGLCRLLGVEVLSAGRLLDAHGFVEGRDAEGRGRVFVANHRSGLDVPVLLAHVEGRFVSRADLAGWPVIGRAARRTGTVFVDRSSRKSGAETVRAMIASVEAGRAIVIFPEGTTFAGDEVRPFKAGALTVARRTGCELVPVGLAYGGDESSFGDESFGAHMRRVVSRRSSPVGLVVGAPLRAAAGEASEAFETRARQAVQSAVDAARARVNGAQG